MSSLRGTLESISLMDVTQLLNINRKTGRLQVDSGEALGSLYFSGGEVVHAETPNARGETAAFEILEWASGHFEFQVAVAQPMVSIRRSVPDLLMDSARLQDSRRRLNALFPDLSAVPWLAQQALPGSLRLSAEERRILPFFDGYRSFREVMSASGQHDVAVRQAAAILMEAGHLELLAPGIEVGVVPMRKGLFRKADHVELPRRMEAAWTAQGPYARGVSALRVSWPGGPVVERVEFHAGIEEGALVIPRELMTAWKLAEGSRVSVRPAP